MTAVDLLVERLAKNGILHSSDIAEANELFKQQIMNAFNYGQFDLGMEADEYYNQTFKSE